LVQFVAKMQALFTDIIKPGVRRPRFELLQVILIYTHSLDHLKVI